MTISDSVEPVVDSLVPPTARKRGWPKGKPRNPEKLAEALKRGTPTLWDSPIRATIRKERQQPGPKRKTSAYESDIVGLTALGIPQKTIAQACDISTTTVRKIVSSPEVQAHLADMRLAMRQVVLERTTGHLRGLYDWIAGAIKEKSDPKALSFLTKAAYDIEKVSHSAAGDVQKVEVQSEQPREDLKELLAVWLKSST